MAYLQRLSALVMVIGTGVSVGLLAQPAQAGGPVAVRDMKALSALEKGLWEVRERGNAPRDQRPARQYCVQDMSRLMQVNHDGVPCNHFIVADGDEKGSVTYQCNGKGAGRTDLRMETSRLAQIETQGIADGMPFSQSLEARYVGRCR